MAYNTFPLNEKTLPGLIKKAQGGKYGVPKWLQFADTMSAKGVDVNYYEAKKTFSKYVRVTYEGKSFLVRFSNHKPNKRRQAAKDCDYFTGVSNFGVVTTEYIIAEIFKEFGIST